MFIGEDFSGSAMLMAVKSLEHSTVKRITFNLKMLLIAVIVIPTTWYVSFALWGVNGLLVR